MKTQQQKSAMVEKHFDELRIFVQTPLNRSQHLRNYEVNTLPSETVPDQTMSIRTIMDRYARGLPVEGQMHGNYQEGDDFVDIPDLRKLDLTELQDLQEDNKAEIRRLYNKGKKALEKPLEPPKDDSNQKPDTNSDEGSTNNP